jgi:putative tricarboxylic transport membrane protein
MRSGDMNRTSGFIVFLFGVAILWEGRQLNVGAFKAPGPGLFPFILAIILMILSIFLIISKDKKEFGNASRFWFEKGKRLASVYISLLAYFFFLRYLGFIITSFLLMAYLFKKVGSLRWYMAVLGALVSMGSCYLIFEKLLKSYLPKGILGF